MTRQPATAAGPHEWLRRHGHEPLGYGKCRHHWRNRTTVVVNHCAFMAGVAAALDYRDILAIEAEAAALAHPRTYSLTASGPNGELFLVSDDESGMNIGYAKQIGAPLASPFRAATIDVERLARALHARHGTNRVIYYNEIVNGDHSTSIQPHHRPCEIADHDKEAAAIAAAYEQGG